MKYRLILLLILLPALLGCARQTPAPTVPVQTTAAVTTAATAPEVPEPTVPETTAETCPPQDDDLVCVTDHVPGILTDLKYSTTDNFTGKVIYSFSEPYLRCGTVKKLASVQEELRELGLTLLIWDAFRPVSAQFRLWEVYPDPAYVADPTRTHSAHSRGNTVDITLADLQGKPLVMPTEFDVFSPLADRDYSDCGEMAQENAKLLQRLMESRGFKGYFNEWWHYTDTESYPVEECFDPALISQWYVTGGEYTDLWAQADPASPVLTHIPRWTQVTLLGRTGEYALVDCHGIQGYLKAASLLTTEAQG